MDTRYPDTTGTYGCSRAGIDNLQKIVSGTGTVKRRHCTEFHKTFSVKNYALPCLFRAVPSEFPSLLKSMYPDVINRDQLKSILLRESNEKGWSDVKDLSKSRARYIILVFN